MQCTLRFTGHHADAENFLGTRGQLFTQHEARGQVLEVRRRGKHHHLRTARELDGHWGFFGHVVGRATRGFTGSPIHWSTHVPTLQVGNSSRRPPLNR